MFKLNSIPEKLARITSGRKIIKEIDGLRFMAIMPVLVLHIHERFIAQTPLNLPKNIGNNPTYFTASMGFLGVYLFFVVSGFILALPFASSHLNNTKKIGLKKYYWRRFTRLEPPFIIWTSIFFIIFLLVKNANFITYLPHYLASITYTHALFYQDWPPFNPPTWTLEIEIQFYLIAPFLANWLFRIADKLKRRITMFTLVTSILIAQQLVIWYAPTFLNPYQTMPLYFNILGHFQYFLIGFILADIYLTSSYLNRKRVIYDFVGILSVFALITGWSWNFGLGSRIIVLISLFLLFCSAFKGVYLNKIICNRWIVSIGGMCYTIYLIHLPIAEFIIKFSKNMVITNNYEINFLLQLLIYIPITLTISAIFFLLIEKPCMEKDWLSKLKLKLSTLTINKSKPNL